MPDHPRPPRIFRISTDSPRQTCRAVRESLIKPTYAIPPRTGGFTLIEALLAGVILAMGAMVIGAGVSRSMRSLQTAQAYQQAAQLLDNTMTKIDMVGPSRVVEQGPLQGRFDPPYERYTWQTTIRSLPEHYLYDVRVEVFWPTRGGKQRSAVLQTYLDDPPGSREPAPQWENL